MSSEITQTINPSLTNESLESALVENKDLYFNEVAEKVEKIESKTNDHDEKLKDFKKEIYNERLNNITVFGIFASLVTFFSVEIQVFKNIESFWLLIGLTSFLVSAMLLFIFSLNSIIKDRLDWKKDFCKNPIFYIFIFFLLFSFISFLFNFKSKESRTNNKSYLKYNENKTIDKYYIY